MSKPDCLSLLTTGSLARCCPQASLDQTNCILAHPDPPRARAVMAEQPEEILDHRPEGRCGGIPRVIVHFGQGQPDRWIQ